ncbi:MAG: tyrosine-type recombinase/integrase [Solobacterium sp.]|nr:tyrosine-type recombinase/integrase [Solobacterium sp.]MCH4205464.1 tyrosine-type recombinase/integrase [Solobacterium sp.]MCH4226676.1 tyrosine-type recombinase/integrase [Solobacterium sp.]MCH4282151.1 tyrosine-type recombinase/integrase [Solobacterium sp.]
MSTAESKQKIDHFRAYLINMEKADATIAKYIRELQQLFDFTKEECISKELLSKYREKLKGEYLPQTVNGKLNAVNAYLHSIGRSDLTIRLLRVQHTCFINENRELSEKDYRKLLQAALKIKDERMYYLMLTLAGTGIRISELRYITKEAVETGRAEISMKGKNRVVMLSSKLKKKLLKYSDKNSILSGPVFVTRTGRPMDRSNICHEMKRVCKEADVDAHKVFPHNFRHLFARVFYKVEKNISHLADILGHSSIETTRIYLMSSTREYENALDKMQLII